MWVAKALSFLLPPAGRIIVIGIAFAAWTSYQRFDAKSESEAEQLRVELVEVRRQLRVAERIASDSRSRADLSEAELRQLKESQIDFAQDLTNSGLGCPVPTDLRQWLLEIK